MAVDPQIRSLAQRLANLERQSLSRKQPGLAFSTIEDGSITAVDVAGNPTMHVGKQWDETTAPSVVAGPTPPTPIAPLVTDALGGLRIYWDGTFANALVAPMDWARVSVHAYPAATFVEHDPLDQTHVVATFNSATGGETLVGLEHGEYLVFLVTWSLAGKFSPASTPGMGSPAKVSFPDLDQTTAEELAKIQEALDTANAAGATADNAATAASTAQQAADDAAAAALAAQQAADAAASPAELAALQAVADQAAADAAAAQADADAAATAATNAHNEAVAAADAADAAGVLAQSAMDSASEKNTIIRATYPPLNEPNSEGDLWWYRDAGTGRILGFYHGLGGTSWAEQEITNEIIGNLDAGKITFGTMSGERIEANSLVIGQVQSLSTTLAEKATQQQAQAAADAAEAAAIAAAATDAQNKADAAQAAAEAAAATTAQAKADAAEAAAIAAAATDAQAKAEAEAEAARLAAVASAATDAQAKADAALAAAKTDATSKANAAQAAAATDASTKASNAQAAAISAAAADATTKANDAKAAAEAAAATTAQAKADLAKAEAIAAAEVDAQARAEAEAEVARLAAIAAAATDAQNKANTALAAAQADATSKANTAKAEALAGAATDATSKANAAQTNAQNFASSNYGPIKTRVDGWTYTGKTTINGGAIEADTVTATQVSADIIVANESYAREGYIGKLYADQIESGQVDATLAIVGGLEVGANIKINPAQGIVIQVAGGEIVFPTNGGDAKFTGNVVADTLTVKGGLSIRGEGAIEGTLELSNGITRPDVPPTISARYQSRPILAFGGQGETSNVYGGMVEYDSNRFAVMTNYFGCNIRLIYKDSDFYLDKNLLTTSPNWGENFVGYGFTKVGGHFFVLGQDNNRPSPGSYYGDWYIYKINATSGAKVSEQYLFGWNAFGGVRPALVALSSTTFGMLWQSANNNMNIRFFTDTFGSPAADDVLYTPNFRHDVMDAHYGPHGAGGANRLWLISRGSPDMLCFKQDSTYAFSRHATEDFPRANNALANALTFDTAPYSTLLIGTETHHRGSRFMSFSGNNVMHSYGRSPVAQTIRASYAWYDGNPTGGTHITEDSDEGIAAVPARAMTHIQTDPAPDIADATSNPDKANQIVVYASDNATPRQQAILGVGKTTYLNDGVLNLASAVPSPTNQFLGLPGVTPGILRSFKRDGSSNPIIDLQGNGSGRVGPHRWDENGNDLTDTGWIDGSMSSGWTRYNSSFPTFGYRRHGNKVRLSGLLSPGTTTANTTIATLPVGYRPTRGSIHVSATCSVSGQIYRFQITTAGAINVSTHTSGAVWVDLADIDFYVD